MKIIKYSHLERKKESFITSVLSTSVKNPYLNKILKNNNNKIKSTQKQNVNSLCDYGDTHLTHNYKKLLHSTIQLKLKPNYTTNGLLPMIKDEFATHYLIEFHKILCIKFPIDLWLKCCLHFIEFVPYHIFEPGMSLVKVPLNFFLQVRTVLE